MAKKQSPMAIKARELVDTNPRLAATLTKLIKDSRLRDKVKSDKSTLESYSLGSVEKIASGTMSRQDNRYDILKLFPDIELCVQIIVSSLMAPNSIVEDSVNFSFKKLSLPPEVSSELLDTIRTELDSTYGFTDSIPDKLRDALFTKGCSPTAVIPESAVNDIINGGITLSRESIEQLESGKGITSHKGILSSETRRKRLSHESDNISGSSYNPKVTIDNVDLGLQVLDNPNNLLLNGLMSARSEADIDRVLSNESEIKIEDLMIQGDTTPITNMVLSDVPNTRESIGRPTVIDLPAPSVVPVHNPNNPSKHYGYFILLDETYNPVNSNSKLKNKPKEGLEALIETNDGALSKYLINKAKTTLHGLENSTPTLDNLATVYSELVENDLQRRVQNGLINSPVNVEIPKEVSYIMLNRALRNHNTKLLFLPSTLVNYFAYRYYDNGTGKSLLDDLMILASIRAILLMAKVIGMVKNSIPITKVIAKLDERDPHPLKTVNMIVSESLATKEVMLPMGLYDLTDIATLVHRAGFEYSFSGHPKLPDIDIDFEYTSSDHKLPDDDVDEKLRHMMIFATGLTPEQVDNSGGVDFAQTLVSQNLLFSRRLIQYAKKLNPQITDYAVTLAKHDYVIRDKLNEIVNKHLNRIVKHIPQLGSINIKDNKEPLVKWLVGYIIDHLDLSLPKPKTSANAVDSDTYSQYEDLVDKVLESFITTEILDQDIVGDASEYVDAVRANFKAYFMRKFLADNNVVPEIAEVLSGNSDENALTVADIRTSHLSSVMDLIREMLKQMKKEKLKTNKALDKITSDEEDEEEEEPQEPTPEGNQGPEEEPEPEEEPNPEEGNAGTSGTNEPNNNLDVGGATDELDNL